MSPAAPLVASIRFRAGIGGEPVLQEMSPSGVHDFRPARWGATIVGSPAHPVAGDHHGLKVAVGVGCCAEMRSSAATVARRGSGDPAVTGSSVDIRVTVASDGMLTWRPEPGVAADGCQHRSDAKVELASSARLLWRDEFLIERRSEAGPGTWSSRVRVVRDGWPVLCTELALGPRSPLWESPAVLEGARAVSLMVVVDPGVAPQTWTSTRTSGGSATGVSATGVGLPLAGPGVQLIAWGDDLYDCRATIESMVPRCGVPEWAATGWHLSRTLDAIG